MTDQWEPVDLSTLDPARRPEYDDFHCPLLN